MRTAFIARACGLSRNSRPRRHLVRMSGGRRVVISFNTPTGTQPSTARWVWMRSTTMVRSAHPRALRAIQRDAVARFPATDRGALATVGLPRGSRRCSGFARVEGRNSSRAGSAPSRQKQDLGWPFSEVSRERPGNLTTKALSSTPPLAVWIRITSVAVATGLRRKGVRFKSVGLRGEVMRFVDFNHLEGSS